MRHSEHFRQAAVVGAVLHCGEAEEVGERHCLVEAVVAVVSSPCCVEPRCRELGNVVADVSTSKEGGHLRFDT